MRVFVTSFGLLWAAFVAPLTLASPLPDSEYKSAFDAAKRSSPVQAEIAAYSALLENSDLTDDQRAKALAYRGSAKSITGNDKIGAAADYKTVIDNYAHTKYYKSSLDRYKYNYTQIYHMSKRIYTSSTASVQFIEDMWGLGYWDIAIEFMEKNNVSAGTNSPLLRTMIAAGYLCETPKQSRYSFNLNNVYHYSDFCAPGTSRIYKSPQSSSMKDIAADITALHKTATAEKGD